LERLVSRANFGILGPRQKRSIGDGYWRGAETLLFLPGEMRKGLQTLDFSFEAEWLTHFGGLFLIQRFCNKLCLRRRLERILKDPPKFRPQLKRYRIAKRTFRGRTGALSVPTELASIVVGVFGFDNRPLAHPERSRVE